MAPNTPSRLKLRVDQHDCRLLVTALCALGALTSARVAARSERGMIALIIPEDVHRRFAEYLAKTTKEPIVPEYGTTDEHQQFIELLNKRASELAELFDSRANW